MKDRKLDGDPLLKVERAPSELIRSFAGILARAQIDAAAAVSCKSAARITEAFEPSWGALEKLSCEAVGAPRYSLRKARRLRDAQAGIHADDNTEPGT